MEIFYRIFLIFHIILATVAAVFGISTLVLGFKNLENIAAGVNSPLSSGSARHWRARWYMCCYIYFIQGTHKSGMGSYSRRLSKWKFHFIYGYDGYS